MRDVKKEKIIYILAESLCYYYIKRKKNSNSFRWEQIIRKTMPFGRKNHMENIKRSSYYVCFIGAKESPVVRDHNRGHEFVYPAMHYLLRTVIEAGPLANAPKITLQVSGKGLKIIQNVSWQALTQTKTGFIPANNSAKSDTLKHTIPHHCVTCAYQGEPPFDDLVATILLIFNPATHCPVHIHVYRCDSHKTAALLTQQLLTMSERPENQARFAAIEGRLLGKGILHPVRVQNNFRTTSPAGGIGILSDGQSSGRTSSSPETSEVGKLHRPLSLISSTDKSSELTPMAQNVDKLTAELKERLKTRDSMPILLPPKDYDTVNRSRGRTGINVTKVESDTKSKDSSDNKRSSEKSILDEIADRMSETEDDDWTVEEEEDFIHESAVALSKADFNTFGFHDRLKRYSSLNDVFGESKTEFMDAAQLAHYMAAKVPELGSPSAAVPVPVSSDANAAYRPRPYYFSTVEESDKKPEKPTLSLPITPTDEKHSQRLHSSRRADMMTMSDLATAEQNLRKREAQIIIQSRNVRPAMPLKRNQRPVVNERGVRPSSFYERIRFDDMRDFQEGRFVRPEIVYYQYRC